MGDNSERIGLKSCVISHRSRSITCTNAKDKRPGKATFCCFIYTFLHQSPCVCLKFVYANKALSPALPSERHLSVRWRGEARRGVYLSLILSESISQHLGRSKCRLFILATTDRLISKWADRSAVRVGACLLFVSNYETKLIISRPSMFPPTSISLLVISSLNPGSKSLSSTAFGSRELEPRRRARIRNSNSRHLDRQQAYLPCIRRSRRRRKWRRHERV